MKENSKLILLHIGKGHKKYMYKSWEIGSLWFNSTTKLYLIKMLILSLCLPSSWIFFFIHFLLAVGSTRTFNVRAEDADICQFLFTFLIEKRGEHDLELKSELLSWKLQAIAIAKQLDFLVCFWEETDLKWLRKWENSMNIVCRVGRGFQLLQAFYFNLTYL